jgi:site-specific DNA recombinase
MRKKVWCLYRVSTDRQGAEGDDIPLQSSQCHTFADKMNWTIVNEITEKLSGFSVAIEDRDSLRLIKKKAVEKEFDILLLYHSDRLGRQMEYSLWIASLYELGIQVWSVKEGELKNQEHGDALMNFIRYWQSEGESRKTSIRVQDAMAQLNGEGFYMGGTLPYGYMLEDTGEKRNSKKDKTVKKLVVNPEESSMVELMFSLVLDKYYGASKIAKHLNDMGVTNRGNLWRHNSISRMLRNPVYMGYKKYNTTEKKTMKSKKRQEVSRQDWKLQPFNPELTIISEETFKKVQDVVDSRFKQGGQTDTARTPVANEILISGLAVCGCCGHKLKSDYSFKYWKKVDGEQSKYKVYRYVCHHSKNLSKEEHTGQKQFGAKTIDEKVEQEVLEAINSIKLEAFNQEKDSFDFNKIDSRKIQLLELKKQWAEKDKAYKNTEGMFDKIMSGEVNLDINFVAGKLEEYGKVKVDLQHKIDSLEAEIHEAGVTSTDLDKLKYQLDNWVEKYQGAVSLDVKKAMLSQVVKDVELSKESIKINFHITVEKALESSLLANIDAFDADGMVVGDCTTSHRNRRSRLHD